MYYIFLGKKIFLRNFKNLKNSKNVSLFSEIHNGFIM